MFICCVCGEEITQYLPFVVRGETTCSPRCYFEQIRRKRKEEKDQKKYQQNSSNRTCETTIKISSISENIAPSWWDILTEFVSGKQERVKGYEDSKINRMVEEV